MAAEVLAEAGLKVTIADQMPSVGRKFLMAGKSGLNLTKTEPDFISSYHQLAAPMAQALVEFGPDEVIAWAKDLGQDLFTGSTGRVFPVKMKASPLLRAWLGRLAQSGVEIKTRWRWAGWDGSAVSFETPEGSQMRKPSVTIFALGGASWARLGSDGKWVAHFDQTEPFKPSNVGFRVDWSDHLRPVFGHAVKNVRISCGATSSRGEFVITESGLEGGGIYEISQVARDGAPIIIDLLPDTSNSDLEERWSNRRKKQSVSQFLKKSLRLSPAKIALLHEVAKSNGQTISPDMMKHLNIGHQGTLALDGAISTAGGLQFGAVDQSLMLRKRPGSFIAGEMLDWDAPTGGYLLTACFASGRFAARGALAWLAGQAIQVS